MRNKQFIGKIIGDFEILRNVESDLSSPQVIGRCINCGKESQLSYYMIKRGKNLKCKHCIQLATSEPKVDRRRGPRVPKPYIEMIGKRFGKLVVEGIAGRDNQKQLMYQCRCDCGNITKVRGYKLRQGASKSCGCSIKDKKPHAHVINEDRFKSVHQWYLKNKNKLCEEWKNDSDSFCDWLDNVVNYHKGLLIKRFDNSKPFSPDNCYLYSSPTTIMVTTTKYGETALYQLAKLSGVSLSSLRLRYRSGVRGDELLEMQYSGTAVDTSYGHLTFRQLSKVSGISEQAIRYRYVKGIRGDALLDPTRPIHKLIPTTDGLKTYDEISEITGFTKGTIYKAFKRYGIIDLNHRRQNLLEADINGRKNLIYVEVNGVTYTIRQIADMTGLDYNTIAHRYRSGIRGERLLCKEKLKRSLKYEK